MTIGNPIMYVGAVGLIMIGLFTMLSKRNLIKIIIGLTLLDTGVNLLLIAIGYIHNRTAPIITKAYTNPSKMVDPIPQALVLTAIVIGLGVTALALALAIRVYGHYKTLDTRKMRGLKW
ncbi:MAG: sodium:proton antiporter [Candidatus Bipolaricaulota bacterium]|nr:sodium:proton antiporter [Candidatus Bipolaricaulota bacterium]